MDWKGRSIAVAKRRPLSKRIPVAVAPEPYRSEERRLAYARECRPRHERCGGPGGSRHVGEGERRLPKGRENRRNVEARLCRHSAHFRRRWGMRADLLADLCWIVRGGNSGVTPRNGVTVTPELRPKGPELRQLRPLRLENNERGNEQKGRRQGGLLRSFGTLRNRNRGTSRPRERSCSGGLSRRVVAARLPKAGMRFGTQIAARPR